MKTISELHRRLQTDNHPPSRLVTWYISKTNSPANGNSSGDLDTELSKLSVTDISYAQKTRGAEKYDPAI